MECGVGEGCSFVFENNSVDVGMMRLLPVISQSRDKLTLSPKAVTSSRRLCTNRSSSSLQSPPSPLSLDVLSPSLSLSLSVSLAPEVTCRPRRCSTPGVRVLFGGAAAKLGRTGTGVSPRERVPQSTP